MRESGVGWAYVAVIEGSGVDPGGVKKAALKVNSEELTQKI